MTSWCHTRSQRWPSGARAAAEPAVQSSATRRSVRTHLHTHAGARVSVRAPFRTAPGKGIAGRRTSPSRASRRPARLGECMCMRWWGGHSTRRSQKSVPKLDRAARGNSAVRRVAWASSTFHQTPSQQMNAHQWAPSPQTARAIRNVTRRVEGAAWPGAAAGRVRQWAAAPAGTPTAARDDAKGRMTAP